tara:strand:- start:14530 stop:22938 length:8409 start_codon:yes stop_codon:yes gene_type:complete
MHYTGHTFSLKELNTLEHQKSAFIESLNIKLDDPELLVKDLALMLRSLEVMENLEHLPEFKTFLLKIADTAADFVSPTEMIPNGGMDITYETANLVTNSSFAADAFEVELLKNAGFDSPVDMTQPWANGIAYKYDILYTEGTQIVQAYSDGLQVALAWFEAPLKANTQYKFAYDLIVSDVNWDLPDGAVNMVDQLAPDTGTFSEQGGGPDPKTYICSVLEDPNLVRPTCDGVEVQWDTSIAHMETTCTGAGGTWFEGNINDPNTQAHTLVPYHLEAREGDTIIFTNPSTSILVHNAVSDDNISFASPDLNPGEDWAWVVDGYHDLYFHCTFHPLEEGRLTSTTNHRFVYSIDHALNPGDTIKVPINYGTNDPLPSLSNSYPINIAMPQTCTSIGGAGNQNVIESLYHNLSLDDIVTFQSGDVETNPQAGVPVDVLFSGGADDNTVHAIANTTVSGGVVTDLQLVSIGSGYISIPTVYITGGGGAGATATIEFSGILSDISVTDVGVGYTSPPTVSISAPDVATIPDGAGGQQASIQATATCQITAGGEVDFITIVEPGTGYHSPPTISLVGGGPTVTGTVEGTLNGAVLAITLTSGGTGYGSGSNAVPVGERKWEEFIVTAVQKGNARVDVFFNDENNIGHVHTAELTTAEYAAIQLGNPTVVMSSTDGDGSGENAPHAHSVTYDWDPALNNGAGGMYVVGMSGSHTHGMDAYYDISGGTKIELTNFGHYHELLLDTTDEATLKANPLTGITQDNDGTWSATGGTTLIRTSDYGTSDPQHFHTLEMGCSDPANDIYLIIAIDQHIHDFDRVWYPGSSQFTIGHYNFALGGDDLNPTSITTPITDVPGYVKKLRGIESDTHGLEAGDRVHYQNIYNGIHHGNTNYYVDYVIDQDHFVLTETVIYPLENAPGTTPTEYNVVEEYTVVTDMASYRFEVDRDFTNHFGDPFVSGVEMLWSRPRTVKSNNHGLSVGDIVQLPSGPLPYTPTELPGEMRDHVVIALGDGYGPTDNLEITVDTAASITFADPNTTTVEGAQDTPWYWSWWDRSDPSYFPYQRDEAVHANLGGNEGIVGGFDVFRGGTYTFINNAWHHTGYATMIDPFTGAPMSMYLHAAGIKAIPGAGWDNLVQAGMTRGLGDPDEGYHCISKNANHGLTIVSGDHNEFISTDEEPGTWVSNQSFPECMALDGWCEALDVDGWYYNGVDDYSACEALNPGFGDVGLPQWRASQWIGNFSKEFTWKIPEDFGLTGADGQTGFGPFNPPGAVNGYYAVTSDQGLYKFDKEGMIEGTNRTINLYRGGTYRFRVNAPGHPMYITTDDGSHFTPGAYFGEYLLGVSGTRAEEGAGDQNYTGSSPFGLDGSGVEKYEVLEFTVPSVAPDTLYYQCAWHASMIGTLNIIDIPVVNAGDDIHVYYHHGQDNMYTPIHVLDKILVDNGSSPNYFQVQPEPEHAFPVAGTQADILGTGNLATATGPGDTPSIQAANIELGSEQYIDPVTMIPGIGSEQFLVTNQYNGNAVVYMSTDIDKRANIALNNVTFKEVVWTETGSWQVGGGSAWTSTTEAGYLEQLITGALTEGVTYEVQYDITEDFKDDFGAPSGTITASIIGDTTVTLTPNTLVGHYTETITAPANTTTFRLDSTGMGKIDNASIRERVTGQNAWYMGEGWSSTAGAKAYIDGSIASPTEISQTVAFDAGKLYEVKYNVADMDPNDDGMTGRLRVTLGHNPNNLISNWNFDIIDTAAVNWAFSGVDVSIVNEKMEFLSSVNGTATYTLASSLVKNAHYEVTLDTTLQTHNIYIFTVGPGPSGSHSHTFQITQEDADWLMEDETRTRAFPQSDAYHAETYTHEFTLSYATVNQEWILVSQTIPEGHEDLALTSTVTNNPSIEIILDSVVLATVTESGIHHLDIIGENTADFVVRVNGTGSIDHIKLFEEEIPILDYDSTGLVHQGEVVHHVRAGSHDSLIHFIADVDNNRPEENNPYYLQTGWEGSIDEVSVREIEEKWTFAPQQGASAYVDQIAGQIYTAGTGTSARGIAHISFEIIDQMSYKVNFNVDRPTDSIIKIGPSPDTDTYGSMVIAANDTDGDKDFVFKAPVTGVAYLTLTTTGNGFTYWDNISVKTIPNLSSDEYLLLARSLNIFGVPIGGEERWKVQHMDMENLDYAGMPIAGLRTLESYGESIIEDYYDVNKRQTDILNPPIRIDSLSVEFGFRAIAAVNPSCSDFNTQASLPAYTSAADCTQPNGIWYAEVFEFCSDATYTTEVNCIEPNGTWSPGSCSGGGFTEQGTCLAAGTCTDAAYNNNQAMCLGAGTCDNSLYNNNETQCMNNGGAWTSAGNSFTPAGYTWTPGSCSDIAFGSQSACEAPRAVWTPTVAAHCKESLGGALAPAFTTQSACEQQRGIWDPTLVSAMNGDEIEATGEGIDINWDITIGGVSQITSAILLPSRVKYEVTVDTPLGGQEWKITNTAGDYFTYPDPFVVNDPMRIITIYQPDPQIAPNGKAYGEDPSSPNHGTAAGGQFAANEAEFYIYGIGFDPASTVKVQKSSSDDMPGNYAVGGDNTTIYETGSGVIATYVSSTEIKVHLTTSDIPAGHDASLGSAGGWGVMYYDVTVTNPDGQTFTEKANAVPGSYAGEWITVSDGKYSGITPPVHSNQPFPEYAVIGWDPNRYSSGNGVRVFGYTLEPAVRIQQISNNLMETMPDIFDLGTNPEWAPAGVVSATEYEMQVMGASDDGAGNQSCVVTLVPAEGTGLVYTPEIATAANATAVRIINGAVDVNTGLYPPHGSYDIILTNDDGSYDIVKKGFHYGPGPWS